MRFNAMRRSFPPGYGLNERNTAAISSERPFRFPAHTFANSAGSSVTGKWTRGGTLQASAMTWAVCWADFWQALYAHAKKLREGHAHEADAPHRRPSNFEGAYVRKSAIRFSSRPSREREATARAESWRSIQSYERARYSSTSPPTKMC